VVKTKIVKEILKDIKNIFHIRDKKKFVIKNLPYLFFFYLANIFSRHINSYVGGDYVDKMIVALSDIGTLSYLPSFHIDDLFAGICFSAIPMYTVRIVRHPYSPMHAEWQNRLFRILP